MSAAEGLAVLAPGYIRVTRTRRCRQRSLPGVSGDAGRRMAPMPSSQSALVSALGELTGLGTERDREQLAALLDRLDAARLRVLVVGEAKRGKSTLINALLGRAVLPTGVTPLTAVPTTVTHGTGEAMEVAFAGGRTAHRPLSAR